MSYPPAPPPQDPRMPNYGASTPPPTYPAAPPPYGSPPPPGYYGPTTGGPGGYCPAPGETAPPGWLSADETSNALWSHLGALLVSFLCGYYLAWIVPLVIRNGRGRQSAFVRDQATEALNFSLTALIITLPLQVIAMVFYFAMFASAFSDPQALENGEFGFSGGAFAGVMLVALLSLVWTIFALVVQIIASIRSNRGTAYRYPINFRMLKAN